MATRVCPKCKLVNPESAALCDCGHVFDPAGAEAARAAGFQPRDATHPRGVKVWVKIEAGLFGFLLGASPVYFAPEIRWVLGERGELGGAAITLGVLMGLTGMCIALAVLDRVHAHRAKKARDK
ncbi:MAG TPA: hypothetical protein PK668_20325 [Myxococcota bacterium]|nr:hypothetical protein [Myxococcota bacterium]HRY96176.1 hypothetical protein [Myxococcota bacterium]